MRKILALFRNLLSEDTYDPEDDENKKNTPPRVQPKVVDKEWGYEVWMANNEVNDYCGKILHIEKGRRFSMHFHRDKHETFYILRGKALLRIIKTEEAEIEEVTLEEGDAYEINRLVPHQVEALEDTDIIESSTFHRNEDSYRVWRDENITSST
jgi:mannose-6-phosphate isomerase